MDVLTLPFLICIAVIIFVIFRIKLFDAFLMALAGIVVYLCVITAGNTFAQRSFYGNEALQKFDAVIAMPKITLGDAVAPDLVLKAKLNAEGNYDCDHIRRADGKPMVFSVVGDDLICCNHNTERDGYLVPFKVSNNELHVMCGTFPYENEVILDKEASSALPFLKDLNS